MNPPIRVMKIRRLLREACAAQQGHVAQVGVRSIFKVSKGILTEPRFSRLGQALGTGNRTMLHRCLRTEGLATAVVTLSLSLFVTAIESSGMAQILRDERAVTVFAPSNQAFANLSRQELSALLTNRAAMHALLLHYVVLKTISHDDMNSFFTATSAFGSKLRTNMHSEGTFVNGAKLPESDIPCSNGVINILEDFDPGLVHEAVALARTDRRGK